MSALAVVRLRADVDAWRRIGVAVDESGSVAVGAVRLEFTDPGDADPGIDGWTVTGSVPGGPGDRLIDGLPTRFVDEAGAHPAVLGGSAGDVPGLDLVRVDHVVVFSPDLERTCGAIEAATGAPLKRIRDAGGGVRQGFHRLGEVVVEVVERADLAADEPAVFWGLVLVVRDDLDAVRERVGAELIGPGRDAVQSGRRIATVRAGAGLGVPVALMST